MWFFIIPIVSGLVCPLTKSELFNRPIVNGGSLAHICPGYTNDICCDASHLQTVFDILTGFKESLTKDQSDLRFPRCTGCLENLQVALCGLVCSPTLLTKTESGFNFQVSDIFCAAAQLSCGNIPQCLKASVIESELSKIVKTVAGESINLKMQTSDTNDLQPISAECKDPLNANFALFGLIDKKETIKAIEPARAKISSFWIFIGLVIIFGIFISKKPEKHKLDEQPWVTIDFADSARL